MKRTSYIAAAFALLVHSNAHAQEIVKVCALVNDSFTSIWTVKRHSSCVLPLRTELTDCYRFEGDQRSQSETGEERQYSFSYEAVCRTSSDDDSLMCVASRFDSARTFHIRNEGSFRETTIYFDTDDKEGFVISEEGRCRNV